MFRVKPALALIFLIAIFIIAGCADKKDETRKPSAVQGEPVISDEYFPTAAGLYKRFDDGQGGWEETVQKKTTFDGKEVLPIHTKMLDIKDELSGEGGDFTLSEFTNFYIVGQEILLVGTRASVDDGQTADEAIPVPSVIFKKGLKKGESWIYELYNPPGKVRATVESFETLTTKAGTFERTAKIKLDYKYMDEAGREVKATAYEWYAPGYGKVKSQGAGDMGTAEVIEVKEGQ